MTRKPKLELTWIGKDERPRLEPRILIEEPSLSHHAASAREGDIYDNMLIQGDNLLALKALEADYAGKVKCVFIDPPYNTGSAFEHYDDGLEHSLWLTMMRDRLEIIRRLLSDDGSLWITIDDNEAHYLKVLCDEVFGRDCFVANVVWEKSDSPRMDAQFFSARHDHLLVYRRPEFAANRIVAAGDLPDHYDKIADDGRRYYLKPLRAMGSEDARENRPSMYFPLVAPDGATVYPVRKDGSDGRWRWSQERTESDRNLIEWVAGRSGWTPYYRIFGDESIGRPAETIWPHQEVGSNRTSKAEIKALFDGKKAFDTPKPEKLLRKALEVATNPGDLVLDSFAGSGTTGAVAHKMGRRWIMVELGEHARTHIVPRLNKVVDGADPGGITEAVGWQGGGGYRFFRLAPSLLSEDKYGNWVISKDYNPEMLAEALCKHMGYAYAPSQSEDEYWKHGQSTEADFIYVTTQQLTQDACRKIADDVGPKRSLLICCKAFSANPDSFPNLTLVKIPTSILKKCEWGRDDYSLAIADLPPAEDDAEPAPSKARATRSNSTLSLFDEEGGE